MDKIRRLILARIEERGIDMKHLSLKMGMNETYVQQFLKRGSPRELPSRARQKLVELLDFTHEELGGDSPIAQPPSPGQTAGW